MRKIIKWIRSLFENKIDFSMANAPRGKSRKSAWQKYTEKMDAIRNSYYRKYSTVKDRR
jgi:hypothetical protein